ncbi:hypothetical protein D5018_10425 [Parashewanella curva]|uniref:Uncharacterized protein n=1 Tax=Parashewanella curva TaxID=2338552 RepID=A0A3L8PWQ0_9GAMM|nr:hypothetical protein [Parashewanella curva]RLV59775.1 hypothetical protein D5018_10425 [Parashewanella curva]
MKDAALDGNDKKTLKQILKIRAQKETKLRRKINDIKKQKQELKDQRQQTIRERNQLIEQIRNGSIPSESLGHSELSEFRLLQSKQYQQERELAEKVVSIQNEIHETDNTIEQLNREVLQLVKDQEKLQAVFDE